MLPESSRFGNFDSPCPWRTRTRAPTFRIPASSSLARGSLRLRARSALPRMVRSAIFSDSFPDFPNRLHAELSTPGFALRRFPLARVAAFKFVVSYLTADDS